jgi:hypothetical protein
MRRCALPFRPRRDLRRPLQRPFVHWPRAVQTSGHDQREDSRKASALARSLAPLAPFGDVAVILDRALEMLVTDLERKKAAAVARPRWGTSSHGDSRHIPADVRRAVWRRDGGRCAFLGAERRCDETAFLEFHHVTPFAAGGEPSVENIQLRAHNQYEADLFCGEGFVARERAPTYVELGPDRAEHLRSLERSARWLDGQADAAPHHLRRDVDQPRATTARAELTAFDAISPAGEAGDRESAVLIARRMRDVGEAPDRFSVKRGLQ